MSGTTATVIPLSTKGLTARFGGLLALDSIDLTVEDGQIVSIIGPNGAGKSTLLNGINGLIRTTGIVTIFGQSTGGISPFDLCQFGVARTFQDPQLIDSETALENVMGGAHPVLGYSMVEQIVRPGKVAARESAAATKAMELLAFAGLADIANRRCKELSYGARKFVDIVRALLSEPKLLLLDEPSSGLDGQERRSVEKLLLRMNATKRVSMLVVEHHMDLVRAVSHQVVALQSGSVLLCGTPSEVLDSQGFRNAMIGSGH